MATTVTVNNISYTLPLSGESPDWSGDVTDLLVALSSIVNTLLPSGSITISEATLADNTSSATNVTGLAFSQSVVRGARVDYTLYRNAGSVKAEKGVLEIAYDGTSWYLARESTGDTGITFSVNSSGQVQYTSTSAGASAEMQFIALALPV